MRNCTSTGSRCSCTRSRRSATSDTSRIRPRASTRIRSACYIERRPRPPYRPARAGRLCLTLKILMTLSLVAAMAASSRAAGVAPAPGRIAHALKIVAFGDSLTSGHRLGPNSAYPSILESRLKTAGLPFTVVNKGISGDTSGRALRRLKAALDEQPQVLILALGANDGLTGVPVAQLRRNLEEIITTAQTQGVQVLLCGMEALPLYGWQYTVEFHQVYPGLAQKYNVPLVPFLLDRVIGKADCMSSEGVDPNAEGRTGLADTIWPTCGRLQKQPSRQTPAYSVRD